MSVNSLNFNDREVLQIHPSLPVFQVQGRGVANLSFAYTGDGAEEDAGRWLVFFSTIHIDCLWKAIKVFNEYLKCNDFVYPLLERGMITGALLASDSITDCHAGLQVLKNLNGGELSVYIYPDSLPLSLCRTTSVRDGERKGARYRVFGNIKVSF